MNNWRLVVKLVLSMSSQDLVPMDTQSSFQTSRLQIQAIQNSVEKLKDVAERMTARALGGLSVVHADNVSVQ